MLNLVYNGTITQTNANGFPAE